MTTYEEIIIGHVVGPAGPQGSVGPAGPKGDGYVLTDADKREIAKFITDNLITEVWTFTLEDGTVVTKNVVVVAG